MAQHPRSFETSATRRDNPKSHMLLINVSVRVGGKVFRNHSCTRGCKEQIKPKFGERLLLLFCGILSICLWYPNFL